MEKISFCLLYQEIEYSVSAYPNDSLSNVIFKVTKTHDASRYVCFNNKGHRIDSEHSIYELGINAGETIYLRDAVGGVASYQGRVLSSPVFEIKSKKDFSPIVLKEDINISDYTDSYQPLVEPILLMQPVASEELLEDIDWGNLNEKNKYELGGILVGKVFSYQNKVFGVIEHVISSDIIGSHVHITFSHDTWDAMLKKLDDYNETNGTDFIVVGWYHTHPVNIAPEFSDTDYSTQRTHFSKYWQFALVLNPQKKNFNAYCGAAAKLCQVVFLQRPYMYAGRRAICKQVEYRDLTEKQLKTEYELLLRLARLNSENLSIVVLNNESVPYVTKYNVTFNLKTLALDNSLAGYKEINNIVLQIDLSGGYPGRDPLVIAISDKPFHPYFDEQGIYYQSQINKADSIQALILELWQELQYHDTHGRMERCVNRTAADFVYEHPQLVDKGIKKLIIG